MITLELLKRLKDVLKNIFQKTENHEGKQEGQCIYEEMWS